MSVPPSAAVVDGPVAPIEPVLRDTEQWFVRRGLPLFVEDYSAGKDVWTRALPALLVLFFLMVTGAQSGAGVTVDVDTSVQVSVYGPELSQLLAGLTTIVVLLIGYVAVNVRRGRSPFARPERVGAWPLVGFVLVPVALRLAWTGDPVDAIALGVLAVLALAVVYIVTRYALLAMLTWVLRWTFGQLGDVYRLATRALPLLLLFMTFLFINTEVWQVAAGLSAGFLWLTLLVFVVLGVVFVVGRMPDEVRRIESAADAAVVRHDCAGTPLAHFATHLPGLGEPVAMTRAQQGNVGVVMVVSQLVQVALLAVLLWAFFLVFGAIAISVPVQHVWTGPIEAPEVLFSIGSDHAVTRQLLRVATFLAGFGGFYVTIYAANDSTYREQFFRDIGSALARSLHVRRAYLALRGLNGPFVNAPPAVADTGSVSSEPNR